MQQKSLTQFLGAQSESDGAAPAELCQLIETVASTCQAISSVVDRAALGGSLGDAGLENVQGEIQKKLDVIANEMLLQAGPWCGHLAAMASEEIEAIHRVSDGLESGEYILLFDPIDGSSNVDVALSVGTIFSFLKTKSGASRQPVSEIDFLQAGCQQVAAGYCPFSNG